MRKHPKDKEKTGIGVLLCRKKSCTLQEEEFERTGEVREETRHVTGNNA